MNRVVNFKSVCNSSAWSKGHLQHSIFDSHQFCMGAKFLGAVFIEWKHSIATI